MGVEQGGPSEEDSKIRPIEPEERVQNVDEAHSRANASKIYRETAKNLHARGQETHNEGDEMSSLVLEVDSDQIEEHAKDVENGKSRE